MATNKNQHFVPRCYLRPFSMKSAKKAINVFNIDRKMFIRNAALKHQCSKDYFYGEDETLENAIQLMEREYSVVLREVLKPGYSLRDDHAVFLKRFWLFQHMRTDAASRRAVEANEEMGEVIGEEAREFKMSIRDAVQQAMYTFATSMRIVDDLKVCLAKNHTSIPFITSDDPAVLTNRWYMEDSRTKGDSFGLNSAGNIFLLPMSPKVLCLGYDGWVHSVPNSKGWVSVKNEKDVDAFNQHQFLNCRANIFVHDAKHEQTVGTALTRVEKVRPSVRHRLNYAVLEKDDGDYKRFVVVDRDKTKDHQEQEALIHLQTIHGYPNNWPKQILWRRKGVVYTNHTGAGYVRRNVAENRRDKGYQKEYSRN